MRVDTGHDPAPDVSSCWTRHTTPEHATTKRARCKKNVYKHGQHKRSAYRKRLGHVVSVTE